MRILAREIRAVALDVDGTLALPSHAVSDKGVDALKRLQAAGVPPIIVTGRAEAAAVSLAHRAELRAPVISCNGALITSPQTGEYLAAHFMDDADVEKTLRLSEEFDLQPFIWSTNEIWTDREGADTITMEQINAANVRVAGAAPPASSVVKVMLAGAPTVLDEIRIDLEVEVPQMRRSLPRLVEASARGFGKASAVQSVLDTLKIDPAFVAGFGDGDTDVEWMSNVGVAIAVDNASPRLKRIASAIIGHHRDDAVAAFLMAQLDER